MFLSHFHSNNAVFIGVYNLILERIAHFSIERNGCQGGADLGAPSPVEVSILFQGFNDLPAYAFALIVRQNKD